MSWESLKKFKNYHNADVYVGSLTSDNWNLPFEFNFTTFSLLDDTIFNESVHPFKDNYIIQWSALHQTYKYFSEKYEFKDDDIVIKLRNDFVFEPFELNPKENTIKVPSIEWHAHHKFNPDLICNDQILYGYNNVMKKYFNLLYEYIWGERRNGMREHMGKLIGIEEMIRTYFYQQNINLETFELKYSKIV